ncbi:MAG: cell surface protein SprA [Candidatus Kapabacteria bacterium]|nr:cell surface protein SprA [Ignavibacteriota bacterium]MCW5885389.1 cell surface protein SprA [Candidatus Kapabacteria bacterium]
MKKSAPVILLLCMLFTGKSYSYNNFSFIYYSNPLSNLAGSQLPSWFFLNYNFFLPIYLQSEWELEDNPLFQRDTVSTYHFATPTYLKKPDVQRTNFYDHKFGLNQQNQPDGLNVRKSMDEMGEKFVSVEMVDSNEVGIPYVMNLDEYTKIRQKQLQQQIWDSLLTRYDLTMALSQGDLARLIGSATGLTIPVPPNPVMSIFGKPEIGINVNGEVNLRIGWRWDSQNLGTVSQFGQTQSAPIFHQDIRVNVSGRVGDKLKLNTDWNTRRTFDMDNTFKVGYEGYDDDIIKLVEVGNVNLPLPTTLIRGGQTLFGVRADFQFGPLFLKTLFSQRRGERRFVDVQGGASKQYFSLRAYDFARNHFFLDTAYFKIYNKYFENSNPVIPPEADPYRIKEIEVYESTNDVREGEIIAGRSIAIADLEPIRALAGEKYPEQLLETPIRAGFVERGNFARMDSSKYRYDPNLGTIHIRNMRVDRYYAVAYRIEGPTSAREDDLCFGNLASIAGPKDTLILKLIYRPNLQPGFKSLWDRQMKNIFDINSRNINVAETNINVWYLNRNNDSTDVIEGAPDKLVTIFQVDQVNNASGAPQPDGLFDLVPPFFDANEGLITFPNVRPFDSALVKYFSRPEIGNPELAFQYMFSAPYDTTYEIARLNTARDRFIISGEVSGRASNRIQLGGFNIARGSVRVTLDGVELIENQDYVIDYFAGTLTLRNQRATLPNANLKVEYEQRDIFNIATKTLAGIRGDFILHKSRNTLANLGFTFMHYDQAAVIDRVRLGEEPMSNSIFGFDGTLDLQAPWLTKALDYLPFYDTKAPSSLTMRGEWAMILPTPNKRTSDIASDNNEPVVYIDDFEGAQRYIPLGLNASQWSHASPAVDTDYWEHDTIAVNFKGRMFWYQYFIPRVPIREVYPNNETYQAGRNFLNPLHINFDPNIRGIYNKNPEYLDENNEGYFNPNDRFSQRDTVKPRVWGGMMRLLSTFNTNFDNENVEFLELMIKVNGRDPGQTRLFIDLGQISEDVIPNQVNDTEDGITPASPRVNGIIDPGEDIGIDAKANDREREDYPFPINQEQDPARDDYAFNFQKDDRDRTPDDFVKYNNYEGNATVSELGQFPDQEVLNRNNGQEISLDNSYFSYEVNLSQYDFEAEQNSQIIGGNPEAGWFLYRIPIRKPNSSVGNPLFSNIQYVRVRVQGGFLDASIADWRLVGSQWQRVSNLTETDEKDSVLSVAFVNLWENSGPPDYYTMPPGVAAPRLLNNPDPTRDVRMNEQSIAVGVKNLRYGEERMSVRFFRPMDIFFYKKLKFFIHGDGSMPDVLIPGAVPKAYAFIRFGIDSSNYYEYRRPLTRGWTDVGIDLIQLSSIKQIRDSLVLYDRFEQPVPGDPYATFVVKGNPILTRVQFFGLGISNPNERFPNDLTTTMWVDELRLLSPEQSADWSGIGSMNLVLADLGTIHANFQQKLPNFHQLEERFGDRAHTLNWNVTMTGNLEKFAPKSFNQMRIPITYTHSEIVQTPEFVANNDINLNEAATAAYNKAIADGKTPGEAQAARDNVINRSQTMQVTDSWAITGFKLGIPVKHWLISETFNKVTVGYSYNQQYERTPIYEERFNWQWRLNLQHNLNIPELLVVKPLTWLAGVPFFGAYSEWKINFLPAMFNTNITMNRRRQTEQSRFLDFPSPIIRDFSANRLYSFSWKLTEGGFLNPVIDYSVNTNSTLVNHEFDEFGNQRTGSEIFNQMMFRDGQLIDFGINNMHTQVVTINLRPMLPNVFSINKYFDITGLFNTTYNWTDPLQSNPEIRDIVKNASFNNSIRFSLGFRLKSLGEEWFGIQQAPKAPPGLRTNRPPDTTKKAGPTISMPLLILKTIFFDWEKVDFVFNQQNSSTNPGVFGGTGMHNFWVNGMTFRESQMSQGPSWAYQMGLIEHPHGGFNLLPSASFPFIRAETYPGLRPANARLQDNFRQTTNLEIKTSRPLWEGARIDLNWKTEVGFNKNQTVVTDEFGNPSFTNIISVESFNRTFHTFPTIFGLNVFNNSIENVIRLYEQEKVFIDQAWEAGIINDVERNQRYQEALNNSFYEGLEAFSLSKGGAGKFLPAVNWSIRWEGLEKFALWKNLITRMSVDHQYVSTYQENAQITDNGRAVLTQTVQYGFQPFIGVNVAFDEDMLDGILTATLRWSNTKSYNINNAARASVNSQLTNEITAQASYTMRGFEFPIFGINLKNDLEYSFLLTYKRNKRHTFDITRPSDTYAGDNSEGETLDGNTQIIVEPRARYSLSSRLTASFFVRYEGTFTEGAAQPGFHTTQVGFDLRISIAGGR